MTPFLTGDWVKKEPAWSPAGNLFAYVSNAAGNDDIWVCDRSGANPINLTGDYQGVDARPAWSHDGQHLAFYSIRAGVGVYTMTALGAQVRKIVSVKSGGPISWGPDNSLIYSDLDTASAWQVFQIQPPESIPRCLTCGVDGVVDAYGGELSPSGHLLVFHTAQVGGGAKLYVLDVRSRLLHAIDDRVAEPHWSDATHVMFMSQRDGLPDLWEVGIDPETRARTGPPTRLTSGLDAEAFSVASTDAAILAVKETGDSHIWSFPAGADRIASPEAGRQLTTGGFHDGDGRWATDGRSVFFESDRHGTTSVWRVSESGADLSEAARDAGDLSRPRPSPTGAWMALDASGP